MKLETGNTTRTPQSSASISEDVMSLPRTQIF